MKTGLLLPFLYRSVFLQPMHPLYGYITCVLIQLVFSHSYSDSRGSSLILNIRKLFLLDLSSRSTNFLQISNAHVGPVVCITPTSSFVELSSFSRLCTFSFMFGKLWSISFWMKLRLSSFWVKLNSSASVFTEVRLSHSWSSLKLDVLISGLIPIFRVL